MPRPRCRLSWWRTRPATVCRGWWSSAGEPWQPVDARRCGWWRCACRYGDATESVAVASVRLSASDVSSSSGVYSPWRVSSPGLIVGSPSCAHAYAGTAAAPPGDAADVSWRSACPSSAIDARRGRPCCRPPSRGTPAADPSPKQGLFSWSAIYC